MVMAHAGTITLLQAASTLSPAGPAAQRLAALGWYLIALCSAVAVLVFALLVRGLRRRGRGRLEDPPELDLPARAVARWVLVGGAAFPAAVLLITLVLVLLTLAASGGTDDERAPDVEVIGHQWWWEVRYPTHGFAEANEIHIPAGRDVRILVRTADVIHSLWVPRLHGKLDLVPGKRNMITLHADRAGVYHGACAEYCGAQHAHMELQVIAHDSADYQAWTAARRGRAVVPQDPVAALGADVFERSGCAYCHTVRGTSARGTLGPDLTHVASRRMIAAGLLPTTRGSFAGWIANPQQLKPGTLMPGFALPGTELRALAAYLESLQ